MFLRLLHHGRKDTTLGWTTFFLGARLFGRVILLARPIGSAKMAGQILSESPIETQLEILLFVHYYLNKTCSFHFKHFSIKSFVNEAFVI